MAAAKKTRAIGSTRTRSGRRWSRRVMRTSNALDLESGVFTRRSPRAIALSLKRSAQRSRRRKSNPYGSAMSMLNFHINRGGAGLSAERRRTLAAAKDELRKVFGRTPAGARAEKNARASAGTSNTRSRHGSGQNRRRT